MNSLRRHYREELEHGLEIANAKVVRRLFRLIEQGSTPAAIFWLKTRAGWKEGQVIEVERKQDQHDFSRLTDEERMVLRTHLEKIADRRC